MIPDDPMTTADEARWASVWEEYTHVQAQSLRLDAETLHGFLSTLRDIRALPEVV